MRNLISKHVAFTILVGILLILAVIFLEDTFGPHHTPETLSEKLTVYSLKFGDHLGIAVLSIGAIGLLLELPHMQGYFHKQIVDTITEEKYLKKFSDPELEKIQTKLMKAFFKTEDIDKEGSFFQYYRAKIQDFIGKPYREETTGTTTIRESSDPNSYIVEETISFVCRKLGDVIQKEAKWTCERDEIDEITSFKITVTVPPPLVSQYPGVSSEKVFDKDNPGNLLKAVPGKHGYCLSLEDYQGMDGLQVKVELMYVVSRDRAFSWTMPYVSKGMTCTIKFPPDLKIFTDQFVMEDALNPCGIKPGECVFSYPNWLLPGDGLAFHFRKPK